MKHGAMAAAAILVCVCAFFPGCEKSSDKYLVKRPEERPNLLILLVDSLRARQLQPYGHDFSVSPNLDSFAQKGIRFARAYTQGAHTKVSTASLFTGLIPPRHGVRMFKHIKGGLKTRPLKDSYTTMAELFKNKGYTTLAFSTNPHVTEKEGFGQGFDHMWYVPDNEISTEKVNENVISVMESRLGSKPYFVYVHYMAPHWPYSPPRKFSSKFTRGMKTVRPLNRSGPATGVSPARKRYSMALYNGEILYWDHNFGKLMSQFEERGWLENTVVVVLSDHGEEFLEHGGKGHGYTVYEELLHVPLIMVGEGIFEQGESYEYRVRLIDILPGLCHLAGISTQDLDIDGTNMFKKSRREPENYPLVYAEAIKGKLPRTIRTRKYQIIYNERPGTWELYDIESDPQQHNNIYKKDHPAVAELGPLLMKLKGNEIDMQQVPVRKLTPRKKRSLESLGYIE